MSTWSELQRAGVRIRVGAPMRLDAPAASRALAEAEISRRAARLAELPEAGERGTCDGCWEPLASYVGGLCALCALARWVVVTGRAPTREELFA